MSARVLLLLLLIFGPLSGSAGVRGPVVLLHGLARSADSMLRLAQALRDAGYDACNVAYPSREHTIEVLAAEFVAPAVSTCFPSESRPIAFVTHSMGGILVRQLAATQPQLRIGRVVMLGPPNRGSELADQMGAWRLSRAITGPAGLELGTGPDSLPQQLGPARFEVGVISGRHSINWWMSWLIPGPDDGKVSIERAKLDGMRDFIVLPVTHAFMMKDRQAIRQTLSFLERGRFR